MNQLEPFYNPITLSLPKHARSYMASSYDRRGGNHDWSNYIRQEGSAAVLMDVRGPGCISRLWTADPQKGALRIYIDGNSQPAIEAPFHRLFETLPLSFGIGGESPETYARAKAERLPMGHTSYCPIYFQESCKVTIDPQDDYLYYQINYDLFSPETKVESFNPAASLDTEEIRRALEVWRGWEAGEHHDWSRAAAAGYSLMPGESAQIFSSEKGGTIRGLRIHIPAGGPDALTAHIRDNIWLSAHFDDDEPRDPSVHAPVGPMFLDFGQSPAPRTVLVGTDRDLAYYLLMPMPFTQSARLTLHNRAVQGADQIEVQVLADTMHHEPGTYRFRCTWHIETPFGPDHRDYGGVACRLLNLDGRDNYELLNARAAGTFVGCGFHADLRDAPTDRACGEGDEMFFIDEDPSRTLYGTGTEDYVNDAWGVRGYNGMLSGDALGGEWGKDPQLYGYRLHLSDSVPFLRKGRFTLEHGTGNNCSGLYRSVAYWYMSPESARTRAEERRWEQIRDNVP